MSSPSPLPDRPSLEYMRKEAKSLLRRMRAGDRDALERAYALHSPLEQIPDATLRLADAQLVIAREYGFSSWPRLVRYIEELERQQHSHMQVHHDPSFYERYARSFVAQHARRSRWAGRALAAYVPRFYGLPLDEVLGSTITEDEARLAIARAHGAPSWAVMIERLEENARARPGDWEEDPFPHAWEAMKNGDLEALQRIVAEHPTLIQPSEFDRSAGHTLMAVALGQERKQGVDVMRPIMEWLESRGLDRQLELNERLRGHALMKPQVVRDLLAQGADPNWITPSGVPVLEHALLRYWSAEAVDVLAARTTPRKALWIAAGLGDIDGVRNCLDRAGKPTVAGSRLRPDFVAAGQDATLPPLPDADAEELLVEVLFVAMLNQRTAVIEYLASRGAPVNSAVYGTPLLSFAVGNAMLDVAECLLRSGADPDLRIADRGQTPREVAHEMLEHMPDQLRYRRIAELLDIDPDAVLAVQPALPFIDSSLRLVLTLASDDATRLGQGEVAPENLLFGLLRAGGPPFYQVKEAAGMDKQRFYAQRGNRLTSSENIIEGPELPLSTAANAALEAAVADAAARRRDHVYGLHLLRALITGDDQPVSQLLAQYGADIAKLNANLNGGL